MVCKKEGERWWILFFFNTTLAHNGQKSQPFPLSILSHFFDIAAIWSPAHPLVNCDLDALTLPTHYIKGTLTDI